MTYLILIIFVIILSILWFGDINSYYKDYKFYCLPPTKPETTQDIIDEIEFNEKFRYVKPRFAGWYLGKKIQKNDPRLHELYSKPEFLKAKGKYVKRTRQDY